MAGVHGKYILRLDDACEKRDIDKWDRMEELLDRYKVKPLVGIIPHCEDPAMDEYLPDPEFWYRVDNWIEKGWTIAMHGFNHVYSNHNGGINPVNHDSEFAGEPLAVQKRKIREGISVMRNHGIDPTVFFAPSHTFDETTVMALLDESNIRFISDTPANKPYQKYGITFVPQQAGHVRELPFHTVTFCYHPNTMSDEEFQVLEDFLKSHPFGEFPLEEVKNCETFYDRFLMKVYYWLHK